MLYVVITVVLACAFLVDVYIVLNATFDIIDGVIDAFKEDV